jgi:pimeloyl-ACP methyl ester carboxylesterase
VHRFCNVNGYPLAYVEAGTRTPALLLVHGSMNDYRSFEQQMAPLSAQARTIAVSLRHAYPERWDGAGDDFTVEQHAADLGAFVAAQAQGPMHVLGHSRGGAVALQLALTQPEAVRTLILADPGGLEALLPPSPEGESMARQSSEMFARLRDNLAAGDEATALERFVEELSGPGAWARRTPEQRQVMLDNVRTGPACAQRPSFSAGQVASLAMPILPVTGSGSPARYRLMLEAMRGLNGAVAPIVTIDRAAHGMHRENAPAFNAAVRDFVAMH